jgi:pilus assembly protein Flp/PilA
MSIFTGFMKNNSGATAVEYALIASGISIFIMAAVYSLSDQLNAKYQGVATALK